MVHRGHGNTDSVLIRLKVTPPPTRVLMTLVLILGCVSLLDLQNQLDTTASIGCRTMFVCGPRDNNNVCVCVCVCLFVSVYVCVYACVCFCVCVCV